MVHGEVLDPHQSGQEEAHEPDGETDDSTRQVPRPHAGCLADGGGQEQTERRRRPGEASDEREDPPLVLGGDRRLQDRLDRTVDERDDPADQ
jgi:hypothetical protein